MDSLVVAGTGHRPNKLGGYSLAARIKLVDFAKQQITQLLPFNPTIVSGMALGWDQALATAAIEMQVPLWCYLPFRGQPIVWNKKDQDIYENILTYADKVVVCSEGGYSAQKMQIRNERTVDDSGMLLAMWDGGPGGTANCVKYALDNKRDRGWRYRNCWEDWIQFN